MKVYVASSWSNPRQPKVVARLRAEGHTVYDFRYPHGDSKGFAWWDIDPNWQSWSPAEFTAALKHPLAQAGYISDSLALDACDVAVLVLPCGRSSHLELGYALGAGKYGIILLLDKPRPELMYNLADLLTPSLEEVVASLKDPRRYLHKG